MSARDDQSTKVPTFGEIAERLSAHGYRPLPIGPGTKKPPKGFMDWPNYIFQLGDEQRQNLRSCYTGILTGHGYIALDIDVREAAVAAELEQLADQQLGQAPRRVGQAPKVALLYALEEELPYLATSKFRMPSDAPTDKGHCVEVLTAGKQLVVYGLHKDTKQPYRWNGAGSPLETPVSQLRKVTAEQMRKFIADANTRLALHGKPTVGRKLAEATPRESSSLGQRAADPERFREALEWLPNDYDERDDWIRLGHSIKAALGEEGFGAFDAWCRKHESYDERETRRVWASLNPEHSTAGTLLHEARARGWQEQPPPETESADWAPSAEEGARDEVEAQRTSALLELNERYAVINWQGRTLVLSQPFDPVAKRCRVQLQSIADFKHWMRNTPWIGKKERATWWLDHAQRRQYKGIVFAPGSEHEGHLNLWRGWACEPAPGDCSEWLAMVREVICSGDETLFNYVLDWCADAIQNPTERPGVTLVLLGKQGTGKGTFAQKTFGALFGEHFLHIRHSRHLTGNFNAHLANGLLVFADEALYPGDKQGEGALKALITEPTIPIEFKGKDVVFVANNIRIIMASNQPWVVPAAMDDRRFAVIEVSDSHAQDAPYFQRIVNSIGNGAALLDCLMKRELKVNLRSIPETQARRNQIMMSMDAFEEFWFERLTDPEAWNEQVKTDDVYAEYKARARYALHPTAFGVRLKSLFPEMRKVRLRGGGDTRPRYYYLPELTKAREQFQRAMRREWDWQDQAPNPVDDKEEPL